MGANRYSLTRYSLGSDPFLDAAAEFTAELKAVTGAAVPLPGDALFGVSLRLGARGTVALPSSTLAAAELQTAAQMCANVQGAAVFAGALGQAVAGSKDYRLTIAFEAALAAAAAAGKDMPQALTAHGALAGGQYASKDIRGAHLLSGVLTVLAGAITQETDVVSVMVTLPPGAELRIDSDTYRFTLNGQNILYAQAGDWVKVSRDLLRLDIESASGGALAGNLIYTERYL